MRDKVSEGTVQLVERTLILIATELWTLHVSVCCMRHTVSGDRSLSPANRQAVLRDCSSLKIEIILPIRGRFFPIWWPSGGPNELYRVFRNKRRCTGGGGGERQQGIRIGNEEESRGEISFRCVSLFIPFSPSFVPLSP